MVKKSKKQSVIIITVYLIGVLAFLIIAHTPLYIPCMWRTFTGISCPSCGLTRAFLYGYQLRFIDAAKMNILFVPLVISAAAHFVCAFIDLFSCKRITNKFHGLLGKAWALVPMLILIIMSWVYNIYRGI